MDILAHTLWTNAGARGANKLAEKKGKKFKLNVGWTAFFGVAPDFFAFGIPFFVVLFNILFNHAPLPTFSAHHIQVQGFDLAAYLYQFSHSLVIFALVFILVWVIRKKPAYELLGWALHILIDIPSHALTFYPTPFLFPISNYHFPYAVPWSNPYYMIINYSLLLILWGGILIKKYGKKKIENIKKVI